MKTYFKIFIFFTILIYLACSITSGSWDPISWSSDIRHLVPAFLVADVFASFVTTTVIMTL